MDKKGREKGREGSGVREKGEEKRDVGNEGQGV